MASHLRKKESSTVSAIPIAFVACFFLLVLIPLVFMPFVREDVSAEKRELAPAPSITVNGMPNINVLSETGDYFADHFAFRGSLVDLDATIKQKLFMTSSTPNVVVGKDGWLYYSGTLNDYQRRNSMSEHELMNIATNLSLVQEYVLGQGKGFALAIAPNKNSLYAQCMPFYEVAGEGQSNLQRLMPLLLERGINTCDLASVFASQNEVLYYHRDSHWNGKGALLVYRSVIPMLTTSHADYNDEEMTTSGHVGDVDAMLHPQTAVPEDDAHLMAADAWSFTNEATNVEDDTVQTASQADSAYGSLVMYRDSFGNNLIPYFATAYQKASFSKMVPYNMGVKSLSEADDVVVERAERHIDLFATKPPYMPSPSRSLTARGESRGTQTSVRLSTNGPYFVVEGSLEASCAGEGDAIFVETVDTNGTLQTFEAFHVSEEMADTSDFEGAGSESKADDDVNGDWGYRAYVPMDERGASAYSEVRVLVGSSQMAYEVAHVKVG